VRCSPRARLRHRPRPRPAQSAAADEQDIREFLRHIEQIFDASDLEAAASVFTDDAVISAHGAPDTIGNAAIRELYAAAMAQVKLGARFNTEEIRVLGDLAYERGTYTLTVSDKTKGHVLSTAVNRHIHVLQRQPDGGWKTWRMMTNSPTPSPTP
jgi:uncharacterized protein (TIGR02246 family)